MIRLGFDIEGDGLLDTVTKIHVISIRNPDDSNAPVLRYVGDQIDAGLRLLDEADELYAHNGIGYDFPALYKVKKWKPRKAKQMDTFIIAQLLWPEEDNALEDIGERLGCRKMDYKAAFIEWMKTCSPYLSKSPEPYVYKEGDEWLEYNPVMGDYCDQDVNVLCRIIKEQDRERALIPVDSKTQLPCWSWEKAIEIEHAFAKEFLIQQLRGVRLDQAHATKMIGEIDAEMESIAAFVEPQLPECESNKGQLKEATPPKLQFKGNGEPTAAIHKWFDEVVHVKDKTASMAPGWYGKKFEAWHKLPTPADGEGARYPLKTTSPMRMSDQEDLKRWLMTQGWEPTLWNFKKAPDRFGKMRLVRADNGALIKTLPKLHDKGVLCPNLEAMISKGDIPDIAAKAVRWVIIRHRRGFINSLIENVRPDGTVPAGGFSLGTPTARVRHKIVANIPKAEPEVVLGKECRMCFIARRGNVLTGSDASGLEMRELAHYVGNPELNSIILEGTKENGREIHTLLWNACKAYVKTRAAQKNVNYGWLYGASDKKLAQTAGWGDNDAERVGKAIRQLIEATLPGMAKFMERIAAASKRGYVQAMDGRKIDIRSKHATLNTLLQSAGSICVKVATVEMMRLIRERKLRAFMVCHYHDEVVLDCHPDDARAAGECFVAGLKYAQQMFNMRCPLDGDIKIGKSWADIH